MKVNICRCGYVVNKPRNFGIFCSQFCKIYDTLDPRWLLINTKKAPIVVDNCLWCGTRYRLQFYSRDEQAFCRSNCGENVMRKQNWQLFNYCRVLYWHGPLKAREIAWYLDEYRFRQTANKVSGRMRPLIKANIVELDKGKYSLTSSKLCAKAFLTTVIPK